MTVDGVRGGKGLRRTLGLALTCLLAAGLGWASASEAGLSRLRAAYVAVSLDLEDRLRTGGDVPETRIALGPFGRDVRLSGEIGDGAADRLKALLDANPMVARIHLTSEGGLVDEAQAMADLVAGRGLSTYVPDYCVSACTLVFVRGRERLLVTDGRLGFHAPYDQGLFGQMFQADGEAQRLAYVAAGIDPAFAAEALRVASGDIWIPDARRLLQARVVTATVGTDRLPDSTLDDDPTPAGARASLLRNLPLLAGLEGASGALDGIAAWYLDAYRAGRPEGETFDRLRHIAGGTVARAMRRADDATTLAFGRYLLRAMKAVKSADAEACATIGGTADLVLAQESLEDTDGARDLIARVAARGIDPVLSAESATAPARSCTAMIHAYTQALSKPEAASAMRALVAHAARPLREASAHP